MFVIDGLPFDISFRVIASVNLCGNGVLDAGEECEALRAGDQLTLGCSNCRCMTSLGWIAVAGSRSCQQQAAAPFCGDNVRNGDEECGMIPKCL